MKNLATITNFETKKTGYGHWLVTVELENPNLLLADDDYYWTMNDKQDEPKMLTVKHTTTNSRAIDGKDGYQLALAQECLKSNEVNTDYVDLSTLLTENED